MDFAKFRIRFRKCGDLRFLSHHDLMRAFERMLRRAALPFRSTEGFHPHPRLVFALSLPLGVVGLDEAVELELLQELPPEEVFSRLGADAGRPRTHFDPPNRTAANRPGFAGDVSPAAGRGTVGGR